MNDATHLTRIQYLAIHAPCLVGVVDDRLTVTVSRGEKVNDVMAIVRMVTQPWEDANKGTMAFMQEAQHETAN